MPSFNVSVVAGLVGLGCFGNPLSLSFATATATNRTTAPATTMLTLQAS